MISLNEQDETQGRNNEDEKRSEQRSEGGGVGENEGAVRTCESGEGREGR